MKIPVMIVNEVVLFPNTEYRIETNDKELENLIHTIEESDTRSVAIIHSLDGESRDDVLSFPSIGIYSMLSFKLMVPNSKIRAVFGCYRRVYLSNYEKINGIYYAEMKEVEEKIDKQEENRYSTLLLRSYEKYVHYVSSVSNAMLNQLSGILSLSSLTDSLAMLLPIEIKSKKKYLYELDVVVRAKNLLEQLKEEMSLAKLEHDIDEKVQKELDKEHKEYFLKARIKAMSAELGEESVKENEIKKYKNRLKKLKCNRKVRERIKDEIRRYESASSSSPELVMMKDYIEWMLSLPWEVMTKDVTSLKQIKKTLDEKHYGIDDVKLRILEYIAVKQNSKKERSPILCLIGPPGVGKTSLAYSIGESLNRKIASISVGGINDEAEIVGHRRTYIGALPGRILQGMKKASSNNPVFIIDEIDKMRKDMRGDPASSLLEVLDKEQNSHFQDHYIEEAFDLSNVMFIATANYEEQIPMELKDRLEIIHIPSYTEYEKLDIAKNYLIPKALDEVGLTTLQVTFSDSAILSIVRYYTKEAGVRDLGRILSKILRKIVRENLEGDTVFLREIGEEQVEKYLGKRRYTFYEQEEKKQIGVVNGLAYTPFGGDVLPIEVTYYQGKGNLILTGSLGDVMRESGQIALSYIKANYLEFNIGKWVFDRDIHIHVPEGAVEKDGPSAGIALTTALISSFRKKEVPSSIAMTGEITLQGRILAIGGLREKILGAYRAGIKKIYLPKENKKDLEEIPDEIKEKIAFVLVSNYQEIEKDLFS